MLLYIDPVENLLGEFVRVNPLFEDQLLEL